MSFLRFTFALMLILLSLTTLAGGLRVLTPESEITFQFTQMASATQGRFADFSGNVHLDAAKPEASKIRMLVKTASFNVERDVNVEAVKPEWFNVIAFPESSFESESVKALGDQRYETKGLFTLKGASRPLTAVFQLKPLSKDKTEMTGQFLLRRGDYRIGEGEWSSFDTIANEVTVRFRLILVP